MNKFSSMYDLYYSALKKFQDLFEKQSREAVWKCLIVQAFTYNPSLSIYHLKRF